ncbi:MAG: amino acid ABC transporter ATP-binding protein [Propionibacteriaceae bacterium]
MTSSSIDPILKIRDIHKVYDGGVAALNGVSFDVARGEVIALVGPSGCGKSTLLRCFNGLETTQEGTITLDGELLGTASFPWHQARQKIGMVFQSYELFGHLTVMENLLLGPLTVRKDNRAIATRQAAELLHRVGLLDRASAFPRQLSGGQKQRVAIVRALMMQPEVLLLDEVTASLDPEMVREVLDVISELAHDGMTMIIVTHEMGFARTIADRIIFMDQGQIIESGIPGSFFTDPQTERARQFLDVVASHHRISTFA